MHCYRRQYILVNNRKEGIYNGRMCAFVHVCLLCYYITINFLAGGYIVQTTFQESAAGEENVSWSSKTRNSFIIRHSTKNPGDSDYAHRYSGRDQTKTCPAETNTVVSYTEWKMRRPGSAKTAERLAAGASLVF